MNRLAVLLALALLSAAPLSAQTLESPPASIDYQGRVLDVNGNPLAPTTPTNYTMQFRIYSTATGGTAVWSESQTVTVDNGQFSVRLGEGVAIGSEPRPGLQTIFDARDRFLGLTVVIPNQTPGEISPRLQFLTTPYAMTAQKATLATRATTADSVAQTAGNSSLGATTVSGNLSLTTPSTRFTLAGTNVIELGAGVSGKNVNAGTIGYGTYTPNTLDIVGAGTSTTNRAVKIFAEAGTIFTGPVRLAGTSVMEFGNGVTKAQDAGAIGYNTFSAATPAILDIVGGGSAFGNRRVKFWSEGGAEFTGAISVGGSASFGNNLTLNSGSFTIGNNRTGQHFNLWGTQYGIGIQASTLYQRSNSRFAWHVGGTHSDAEDAPGAGGSRIMTLQNGNGLEIFATKVQGSGAAISLGLDGGNTPGIELRNRFDVPSTGTIDLGYLDFSGSGGGDFDVRLLAQHLRVGGVIYGVLNVQGGARNTLTVMQVGGSNVLTQNSCDISLKRDVRPYTAGLDTILALKPVDFEWRRDEFPQRHFPEGRHVGIIAQEIQPLVPDAVGQNSDGKLSVDFAQLVPHLVGAVHAQQAQIETLEAKNAALEERLAKLEAALARLAPAQP